MNDETTFQRLCTGQIEGTLTEPERAQFVELLKTSPEARQAYATQIRIHAMLAWQHKPIPFALPESSTEEKIVRPHAWRWLTMAAAAVVMLGCGLAAWWQVTATQLEVIVAKDVGYHLGDRMKRKAVEIESGELTFKLTSGATVDLIGPAALQLIDPMHVRLLRGQVTVDVGKQAKGFVVDTATAQVVDLGTRFGVSTGIANATDVAVFEGSVEVYQPGPQAGRKPDAKLVEGEAIRFEKAHDPMRLKVIHIGAGGKRLANRSAIEVVSGVTDNVTDETFRGYYGLMRHGMEEGARIFSTSHTCMWHVMPGESFPQELLGADVVLPFGQAREQLGLKISIMVERPCDVYVMPDIRVPVPEWLQRDFVDTGLRLSSGPWRWLPNPHGPSEQNVYATHAVWKKRVAQPGVVTLGAPTPDASKVAMYGIAVKELR